MAKGPIFSLLTILQEAEKVIDAILEEAKKAGENNVIYKIPLTPKNVPFPKDRTLTAADLKSLIMTYRRAKWERVEISTFGSDNNSFMVTLVAPIAPAPDEPADMSDK